ncbi:MAG: glycerol-3-phosphate 1-O-acyltransferase PlsY [Gammaproteobacteria bacterium]|nr:glycerol-3-phosphate 1-O-acyltransferase PlsY [Gammaproteobacteria bacterium]
MSSETGQGLFATAITFDELKLLIFAALISYMAGSVMGGHWAGRIFGIDLRKRGSGNLGATNALRNLGWAPGLLVFAIDVGKALAAVWVVKAYVAPQCFQCEPLVVAISFLAVVLGHMFPLWHEFSGGKGVATFFGGLVPISGYAVLVAILVWLQIATSTGYVSVASMMAVAAAAVMIAIFFGPTNTVFLLVLFTALLVIWAHRSNIRKLNAGTEHQMKQLLLRKSKTKS